MTVYFVSPATTQAPIGGVQVIYAYTDILNAAGIKAAVIQGKAGYRPAWFENATPIAYAPVEVREHDLVVWPEYLIRHVRREGTRQVVFVLNAYGLFADTDLDPYPLAYPAPALLSVVVVSQDNAEYIRHGWPESAVTTIRPGIDPTLFRPGTPRRQIAYSPRKRYPAVRQVLGLLRARGALDGWDLTEVVGMTHQEVAATLRDSALFLSFSEREGLGLPPIEAIASGCHVIGFSGVGGREIFDPRFAEEIPEDDVVAFARAVEAWLAGYDADAARRKGLEASAWALDRWSVAQERAEVVDLFDRLLATSTASGSTTIRPEETWGPHDRPRSAARRGLGQLRAGLRTMLRG